MSTAHNPIKLYETVVDECPYLPGEQSASIIVDPEHTVDPALFALLSRSGFRRSGEMLYAPKCPKCNACVSVRVPVEEFKISRAQKRVWRKNTDLLVTIEDVSFKQEQFEMYLAYQQARHPDSTMCDDDPQKYISFIESQYSDSKFLCFSLAGKLIGVSIVDQFEDGLSAVYTFFDPAFSNRSLGTYAILYQIKLARLRKIPYVYLGYWIGQSSKMNYKQKFKPLQGFINRNWQDMDFSAKNSPS